VDINTPSKVNVNASNVIINSETINNGNVQINGNLIVSQMLTTGGFTSLGTSGGGTAQFAGSISATDDVIASNVSLNRHLHSGV
jgi:hypothetical protein